MDGYFTRKSRLVANCPETEYVSTWDTYSLLVSKESVRTAVLDAALTDLNVLSCDISNAYIEVPYYEKPWTVAGKKFGRLAGTLIQINKALY